MQQTSADYGVLAALRATILGTSSIEDFRNGPFASLRRLLAGAALIAATGSALAQPLQLQVYNPGDKAVFPVTSSLILGKHDALLVDAQFSSHEADELVRRIQASGKRLTTIFISHGDPDFYFGLDTLLRAFPRPRCWPPRRPSSTSRPPRT